MKERCLIFLALTVTSVVYLSLRSSALISFYYVAAHYVRSIIITASVYSSGWIYYTLYVQYVVFSRLSSVSVFGVGRKEGRVDNERDRNLLRTMDTMQRF